MPDTILDKPCAGSSFKSRESFQDHVAPASGALTQPMLCCQTLFCVSLLVTACCLLVLVAVSVVRRIMVGQKRCSLLLGAVDGQQQITAAAAARRTRAALDLVPSPRFLPAAA